jgi:hypothetical protein
MKRIGRPAAVAVAALVLLAACSSSSSTSTASTPASTTSAAGQTAAAYVAGFCEAFADYLKQVTPSAGTGTDLQKLKGFYLSFFDGEVKATHRMITRIEALGTPAVPGGKQLSEGLIQAFTALEPSNRSLRDEAASLPTSSRSAFNQAVRRLFLQFRKDSMGSALTANPFRNYPQLLAAFRSSPECGRVAAGG